MNILEDITEKVGPLHPCSGFHYLAAHSDPHTSHLWVLAVAFLPSCQPSTSVPTIKGHPAAAGTWASKSCMIKIGQ